MGKYKTLIGLNAAVFLMMLGVGMIMALLPQRIIDLTGSGSTVGYLASAFAISYIILQIPIGNLADRFGFKFFLLSGYLLCCLTGFLYYVSAQPRLFFLGRIVQGAGEAPVWALAPALLSIQYPAAKGRVMGIYNGAIHLGLTIGPILGIVLAKTLSGNRPFLFYAAACLTGACVIIFSVPNLKGDGLPERTPFTFGNILKLTATRNSLVALLGISLYGAGYGMFLTNIPAFLIGAKNFNQTLVGIFFALFYLAISLSQLITGGWSDKMGRQVFMVSGLLIAACGMALFPSLNQPLLSAVLTLASLGLGTFYLASMAYLNEIVPNSLKGTISGAYYLFWGIGFFGGPIVIDAFGVWGKTYLGYQLFALLLFCEAGLLIFCKEQVPRKDGLSIR